jgi:hypothetical protein
VRVREEVQEVLRGGDGALMQMRKAGIACESVYDTYVTDARHAGPKRCALELTPINQP